MGDSPLSFHKKESPLKNTSPLVSRLVMMAAMCASIVAGLFGPVPAATASESSSLPVGIYEGLEVCTSSPTYENPWLTSTRIGSAAAGSTLMVKSVEGKPTWYEIMGSPDTFIPVSKMCVPGPSGNWDFTYTATTYTNTVKSHALEYGCTSSTKVAIQSTSPLPTTINWLGSADMYNNAIAIKTGMSSSQMKYVVAHECGHILQARTYGFTASGIFTVYNEMNRIYGGSGASGVDRNADCITVARGLTGQFYTSSCTGARATAAKDIMALRKVTV